MAFSADLNPISFVKINYAKSFERDKGRNVINFKPIQFEGEYGQIAIDPQTLMDRVKILNSSNAQSSLDKAIVLNKSTDPSETLDFVNEGLKNPTVFVERFPGTPGNVLSAMPTAIFQMEGERIAKVLMSQTFTVLQDAWTYGTVKQKYLSLTLATINQMGLQIAAQNLQEATLTYQRLERSILPRVLGIGFTNSGLSLRLSENY